jgi:CBS domain-containing protein
LASEGEGARERRAIDVLEEPVTCGPTTSTADAIEQAQAAGAPNVLVVNEEGILLGRVRVVVQLDRSTTVEQVMEPGPVTVRANEPLDELVERMTSRRVTEMVVTTPEGRLLGIIRR